MGAQALRPLNPPLQPMTEADLGFPANHPDGRQHTYLPNFLKKLHEIKNISGNRRHMPGVPTSWIRLCIIWQIEAKNSMKIKEIALADLGGGGCEGCATELDYVASS